MNILRVFVHDNNVSEQTKSWRRNITNYVLLYRRFSVSWLSGRYFFSKMCLQLKLFIVWQSSMCRY